MGWETGNRPAGFSWAAGRKGKGEKERCAGWAEKRKAVKEKAFPFLKGFKHIQFKFEFKNSNSN